MRFGSSAPAKEFLKAVALIARRELIGSTVEIKMPIWTGASHAPVAAFIQPILQKREALL